MTIGDRIKEKREENSLTQTELAKAIHSTKQTIYKYEMNIVTNIPSDKIEKIAKILNTTPAYLMGWEENLNTDTDFIADIFSDKKAIEHVKKLTLLKEEDRKSVYDMIDFLYKKETGF